LKTLHRSVGAQERNGPISKPGRRTGKAGEAKHRHKETSKARNILKEKPLKTNLKLGQGNENQTTFPRREKKKTTLAKADIQGQKKITLIFLPNPNKKGKRV